MRAWQKPAPLIGPTPESPLGASLRSHPNILCPVTLKARV